jgi:O-antigen/teichoic acid export membrane protein
VSHVVPQPPQAEAPPPRDSNRKQIRGSALLMAGRGIAVGVNFTVTVLIVRYLTKQDFGALAFALSTVTLVSRFSLAGLDKAASRFAAIYHERRDYSRMFGLLLLMVGTIVTLGTGIALGSFGLSALFGDPGTSSPLSHTLFLSLIVLAPVEAMNSLLLSVFGVFSKARLIFFRRHIVGPLLKLIAMVTVVMFGEDVHFLAGAYIVAGLLGLLIAFGLLVRVIREQRLIEHFDLRAIRVPAKEIFSFSLPMMGSDLVIVLRAWLIVLLLELIHSSTSVADYRAILPVARLNRIVLESFGLLFMPMVARLLVRGESRNLNAMFWKSTTWVTVLSFPVFGLTFAFAKPLTLTLFGDRYADSTVILTLLSLGMFASASVGLNAFALKASGKVRQVLVSDAIAIVTLLASSLILIPPYQALGAAASYCITAILHALMYQISLSRATAIKMFPGSYLRVYVSIVLVGVGLSLLQILTSPPLVVAVLLVAVAWGVVLASARGLLDAEDTFPELKRIPVVREILRFVRRPPEQQP